MSLTFLAPQFLWALLALPLVVLLHFVRSRKKRQEVSALFLWHKAKALAQQRRRFSPTWLLLLQLLFVTLAALALAQPNLTVRSVPSRIFVIDASASMAARDADGVRLARAVEEAEALLNSAGEVAVVRAGLDATVAQPLTPDHAEARRSLRGLEAADTRADLRRAVELARSLAPDAEIHLFTDADAPTGLAYTLHPVGGDAQNIGVSAFELRGGQAFVSVVSSSPRPQEVTVEVSRADALLGSTTLLVPSRGRVSAAFPIGSAPGFYRAHLSTLSWDALPLDDEAWAGSRNLRVLLTPPSPSVERALRALPGLEVNVSGALPTNLDTYDMLVLTGTPPDPLPPGRILLFAPPSETPRYERIGDWDRSDPLLRFVDLTGVRVGLGDTLLELPEGERRVLAQTEGLNPALLILKTRDRTVVALPFHPSQTDMVNRAAFPIFIANVIDAFRGENRLTLGSPLPTDAPITFNGREVSLERATEPGIYRFGGGVYSASLLSAEESLLPTPLVADGGQDEPPAARESERQQSFALWLVLAALVALTLEWLLWSRGRGKWLLRT